MRVRLWCAVLLAVVGIARAGRAAIEWETPEQIPSPQPTSAWFPALAVDSRGRVHVVWADTRHPLPGTPAPRSPNDSRIEQLYYAVREAGHWSTPRPIAIQQQRIYRNAIAVDRQDRLHLLFNYSPGAGFDIYYRQAPAADGLAVGGWQTPRLVNFRWNAYFSDLAVVGDTLHMVFNDGGSPAGECRYCADTYYRRSSDGGVTWSEPVSLRPSLTGSARAKIVADAAGVLHVSWDEGWDRDSGRGKPDYGVYMSSGDGGETWSEPTIVADPSRAIAQLTAAGDGRGGVLLVWRSVDADPDDIFYQWSTDWGERWSAPERIPGIRALGWHGPYDRYELVPDRNGNFHLLTSGLVPGHTPARGLYDLEWNGARWAAPAAIYTGTGIPDYPHLVFGRDGTAHATWFVRATAFDQTEPHRVWYSQGFMSASPAREPRPALAYARASFPAPTPVPYPAPPAPAEVGLQIDWPRAQALAACLVVGAALVGLVEIGARLLRRRA